MNNLFKYITQYYFGSIEILYNYLPDSFKQLNSDIYARWEKLGFLNFVDNINDKIIVSNILEEMAEYCLDIQELDEFPTISFPLVFRLYYYNHLHISPSQLYSLYRSKYMDIYRFIKNSGRKDIDYEAETVYRLVELIKKNVYNR